jgi:hypothetical protein
MTTRTVKHRNNGAAVLEETIPEDRALDIQLDGVAGEENGGENLAAEPGPRSQQSTQQGTQQFVTFMAGDEVFAADMVPVKSSAFLTW